MNKELTEAKEAIRESYLKLNSRYKEISPRPSYDDLEDMRNAFESCIELLRNMDSLAEMSDSDIRVMKSLGKVRLSIIEYTITVLEERSLLKR